MSIESALDRLWSTSPVVRIPVRRKILFVSDLHLGVKDEADDFGSKDGLFLDVCDSHLSSGFEIFLLGDIYDLWENPSMAKIAKAHPRVHEMIIAKAHRIKGNHDGALTVPESSIIEQGEDRILLCHGHQGDFFNSQASWVGKFFVRHIWRNLQMLGMNDPTTATMEANPKKHELIRREYRAWAEDRQKKIIFGHTHYCESIPPYYFNCGTWARPGGSGITVIGGQIEKKIFS